MHGTAAELAPLIHEEDVLSRDAWLGWMQAVREALSVADDAVGFRNFVLGKETNVVSVLGDRLRHQCANRPVIGLRDRAVDQPELIESGDILGPQIALSTPSGICLDVGKLSTNERHSGVVCEQVIPVPDMVAPLLPSPDGAEREKDEDYDEDDPLAEPH